MPKISSKQLTAFFGGIQKELYNLVSPGVASKLDDTGSTVSRFAKHVTQKLARQTATQVRKFDGNWSMSPKVTLTDPSGKQTMFNIPLSTREYFHSGPRRQLMYGYGAAYQGGRAQGIRKQIAQSSADYLEYLHARKHTGAGMLMGAGAGWMYGKGDEQNPRVGRGVAMAVAGMVTGGIAGSRVSKLHTTALRHQTGLSATKKLLRKGQTRNFGKRIVGLQ